MGLSQRLEEATLEKQFVERKNNLWRGMMATDRYSGAESQVQLCSLKELDTFFPYLLPVFKTKIAWKSVTGEPVFILNKSDQGNFGKLRGSFQIHHSTT